MVAAPFVLLDDARPGGTGARLYQRPRRIVEARTVAEVAGALDALRRAGEEGLHAAGYLTYEAGAALAARALPHHGEAPLVWFGLFDGWDALTGDEVERWLPDPRGGRIGPLTPAVTRGEHERAVTRVLDLIAAGDIYQANLTFQAHARIEGDPLSVYAALRPRACAGYGALVDTGDRLFLSLSPELFFARDGGTLTCRPMKGTATRGATPADDRDRADALATDAKQRAENLMIVDLMRNDLSRVARAGSVAVPRLFTVETYPTIHQLTSTVTATLADGRDTIDVLRALFPCGSITGAPKQRAAEVIAAIEPEPRGIYTGSIGRIDADGDAAFNVAIRTLTVDREEGRARMGLGSGIVADSDAADEWAESLAKGGFAVMADIDFDLIETMAFDPLEGILLVERHLERIKASATVLGFAFDRHAARNELQAATFRLRQDARVRLLLAPSGAIAIDVSPPPPALEETIVAHLVPLPVAPDDLRLRHKTSDRGFYDTARHAAGTTEVVFVRPDGLLTEGSFTSLFVRRGSALVTPPLSRGLLPGVLRAELIDAGRAVEGDLTAADLSGGFFLGNALRGLMPATLARSD